MKVIIVTDSRRHMRYAPKVAALDEKFRKTGASVHIVTWGAAVYGYRADLIILTTVPDAHQWDWYQMLETRLSIDGIILDMA